jgi:signal transduction histidine kinase/HAMP domain-containing protein
VRQEKEQRVFQGVLWAFLLGSLIFFIARLSAGRFVLPATIWYMFLLLVGGFIIFTFIPHAGRGVPGVPGRHEETVEKHRWYPRHLAEIIDGRGGEKPARPDGGVYPPSRAVPPVPLVPLVLLGACIILAYPGAPSEKEWREKEAVRLQGVYDNAARELTRLEGLAVNLGSTVAARVDWNAVARANNEDRSALIRGADSLAKSVDLGDVPFREVGLQILSRTGERIAWGGSPRYLAKEWAGEPSGTLVFTSRTPLYTLLVCEVRDPARGSVVVDIPLEVNYRINNRFLHSTSLGEVLSRRYGDEVEFMFSMGEHRGVIGWTDPGLARKDVKILSGPNVGIQVIGVVQASTGLPLARLKVLGDPYAADLREAEARKARWAGLLLSIAVIVVAVWIFRIYFKRVAAEGARREILLRRIAALAVSLAAIRILLVRLNIPGGLIGTPVFHPSLFADAFPGGVMRNAGEFLVSAVFALIFVFGSIKAFRTYYRGHLERPLSAEGAFAPARVVVKAAILFGALEGALALSSNVISRTTINALPRLVGLDVNLLDVPVLVLHLSLLFMVSAIFIAALFVARLALVWGSRRIVEGCAASALAFAGLAALNAEHGGILCATAGLLVLSFRIFPLLRKEEAVSVVFASFFLVLVSSLAVYAVANERYADLRKGYILEKIREFNKPEDNWMQVYLPDICADISNDPSMLSQVVSRDASAAFEIWARSSLSRGGLSCVFEVFDASGTMLSRFAVGMPFDIPRGIPDRARFGLGPFVESLRAETRGGAVFYYAGYAPIFHPRGELLGWVEITIPYFFENPELLARTGRMAPEILQNIDPGGERRRDMPEKLLVARVSGSRVIASSESGLRAGTVVGARAGTWFALAVGKERYGCHMELGANDAGYLVGYRVASRLENLLQWATIVSLDVLLTILSLVVLFALKHLPVLKGVMPDVSPGRGLGFRQKVMLSFLVVSILPVVILGTFSSQLIARRYGAEEENRALLRAQAAVSLIEHSIRTEAASLAGGQYIGELLAGEGKEGAPPDAGIDTRRFTLIGSDGEPIFGGAADGLTGEQLAGLLAGANIERVVVTYEAPILYAGVVVPTATRNGRGGYLYYRRALDDEFVKSVSAALGADINIYYDALVRASSERELFLGGFLDPLCKTSAFVAIALEGADAAVLRETLGDYSYYVASAPLSALGGARSAVLSVPMLYLPILMQEEVRRTSMLVLGLLALLFATTVTLGVFLAGKIFNPIAALQDGTRRIIEGELEFKLEAGAPDEIGELVESFNTMTGALREARRGLLERQRYLAAVLDNIATGVLATGRDGAIITLNPSGERILRVSGAAVVGKRPEEAFGEGLEPLRGLFVASSGDIREVELSLFSGEMARTVKAVVASLVEGGERLGTVVVFDDLTELIRSKKLSAWVEMARQIAHEVKNPLTPIKLSAQLMKKAYDSESADFDGIFKSGVDTVIEQTEILRRIATEFSSFGKAMRLNPEPVPLDAFLGEIVSYYRGAEKVEVRLSCADSLSVRADREALRKILVNLMENAIDAMPDGGEILVSCRRGEGAALVSVVDSGKGLSGEMQARLFEPYFSTKTNGIGLGLAISQNLARSMDGEIRLRNREGARGVEATVTLPLA